MKRKLLLRSGLMALLIAGSLYSFLYLNIVAQNEANARALELGEQQIIQQIEEIESKLPETFLLEQLLKMRKKLIP